MFAGLALLVATGQALWGLLNQRGQETPGAPLKAGDSLETGSATEIPIYMQADLQDVYTDFFYCDGSFFGPGGTINQGVNVSQTNNGTAVRLVATSRTSTSSCAAGTNPTNPAKTMVQVRKSDGSWETARTIGGDGIGYNSGFSGTLTQRWANWQFQFNGQTFTNGPAVSNPLPDTVKPKRPTRQPARTTPAPLRDPAPAPAVIPQAPPAVQPVPVPVPVPGGLPATVPAPAPAPAPSRPPAPAPSKVPASPSPQPVPVRGPIAPAPAGPVITTPTEAVVVNGQQIGGPGASPNPNLQAMAQELGRLERKAELTLEGGATAVGLGALGELIQRLVDSLLAITPGTTYSIQPPCGTKPEGGPLDPVEVIAPGGPTPEVAILNRLDALALLIDEHKQIRQPICKGKPTGSPVTVTALEVE